MENSVRKWYLETAMIILYSDGIDTRNHESHRNIFKLSQKESIEDFIAKELQIKIDFLKEKKSEILRITEIPDNDDTPTSLLEERMELMDDIFYKISFPIMGTMHLDNSDYFKDRFDNFLKEIAPLL